MYGYIYKWANLINGRVYIGKHVSTQIDPKYIGSGKYFRNAFAKYGSDNFSFEVLEWCEDKNSLNAAEKFWIKSFNAQDISIGYNIGPGGEGGDIFSHKTVEDKECFRAKMSLISKGSKYVNNGNIQRRIKDPELLNKLLLEGWKLGALPKKHKNLSTKNRKSKIYFTNGIKNIKLDTITDTIPEGFYLGYTQTNLQKAYNEARKQSKEISKNEALNKWLCEEHYCECCHIKLTTKYGSGKFCSRSCASTHNHSEDTKILIHKYNEQGICGNKGKKFSAEHRRKISESLKKNSKKDTMWISNGKIIKKIYKHELDTYLEQGYIPGRKLEGHVQIPWNKGLTKDDPRVAKNLNNRETTMLALYGSLDPHLKKKRGIK